MKLFGALLALWFGVNKCCGSAQTGENQRQRSLCLTEMIGDSKTSSRLPGSKCGRPQVESLLVHSLRVVGGAEATYGSHPWLVRAFLIRILAATMKNLIKHLDMLC